MEETNKVYWKGIEELTNDSEFVKHAEKEFPDHLTINDTYGDNSDQTNRRDFLKLMGFSVAAVSLASCEAPIKKAVPWLNKPEGMDPSVANYYASTYMDGSDYCSVVVKTREGRPIFVEGNTFSSISRGGVSALASASVMSLYDIEKATGPTAKGKATTWAAIDKEVLAQLSQISQGGGQIRLVSQTVMSPSTQRAINDMAIKYPGFRHVQYDPVSAYGLLEANKRQFGKPFLPSYAFDKAAVVATIGADFLGTWISPIEYTKQFQATRKVGKDKKEMSRLYAFESIMTVTGASADYRATYKPSQEGLVVAKLYNLIAQKEGRATVATPDVKVQWLEKCAQNLLANKGKALVVSGSNDVNVQLLVNAINEMLGSYGTTMSLDQPSFQKAGNDAYLAQFAQELANGTVKGVIFYNCNPVYDHPLGTTLEAGIKKAALSVAISDRIDETAAACQFHCPDNHYLEAWNDAEPRKGMFSLAQPTINQIFNTRQAQQSFLIWAGSTANFYDYLRETWRQLQAYQETEKEFEMFWNRCLHNGVFEPTFAKPYISIFENGAVVEATAIDLAAVGAEVAKAYKASNQGTELVVYPKVAIGTGSQANNPYLHETPDPISKACWGNYVSIPMGMAKSLGFSQSETQVNNARVKVGNQEFTLPVLIQPGQAADTIAIALGFGRKNAGKVANEAGGCNAYPLAQVVGSVRYSRDAGVTVADAGSKDKLAQTQTYQTFMGRKSIIQETVLASYQKNEKAGRFIPLITSYSGEIDPKEVSLWDLRNDGYGNAQEKKQSDYQKTLFNNRTDKRESDVFEYPNHHWGMVIDLNSCTGCSACVTACHIENNVPVVGKKEVINRREMHWMRIDRYYSSEGAPRDYDALMIASDNPEVVFQPMMCQHCNNAPCETVCPVVATTHSSEGVNQMTYNRCVGTKYCANNCPYKVRRFNWFKYHDNPEFDYNMNNDLGRMVLNPDVTVRSRGVMEKCSLCVQRVQAGKLKAKVEKRRPVDGEITTACATACPAEAITFGDLNDVNSQVSKLLDHEIKARAYNVLHEIGTRPNVWYLTKVRNRDQDKA
ncbi:MAG: TAT-variant-translocated molybdopterin oxidoreductase [Bernardetiaceae bacterium]|jgi:molybdopterin-containing oxidoreductase family iron-sulfur binding subunit|nr:TAT-variant-translocated molybdopterin oxidoreductase [Bernardetiaceae bacterium]